MLHIVLALPQSCTEVYPVYSDKMMSRKWKMPAEWSHHAGCWMLAPYRADNWRNHALPAQHAFISVAQAIARFEKVMLGVHPSIKDSFTALLAARQSELSNIGYGIELFDVAYDDCWVRDVGPTILHKTIADTVSKQSADSVPNELIELQQELQGSTARLIAMDWVFNAWGHKYRSWDQDDLVASVVINHINSTSSDTSADSNPAVDRVRTDFVLEGGSIHVDGEGTLIVTEECLLNANRNPQLSKQQIEARLRLCLGVDVIIWLPRGLVADHDTDGHIDNIACFARPGTVLLSWTDDAADTEMYEICREAYNILSNSLDAQGRKLFVVKLPLPAPMYYSEEDCSNRDYVHFAGDTAASVASTTDSAVHGTAGAAAEGYEARQVGSRMAGSYVNFYIANKGIVVPAFGQPETDAHAVEVLSNVFGADFTVVSVEGCREILLGGGNIHCITQQQPAPLPL